MYTVERTEASITMKKSAHVVYSAQPDEYLIFEGSVFAGKTSISVRRASELDNVTLLIALTRLIHIGNTAGRAG